MNIINSISIVKSIVGKKKKKDSESSSQNSKISSVEMETIIEKLKTKKIRQSTYNHYYKVWTAFNKFLIRLDRKPCSWEKRTALYCAYLVKNGSQSQTIRCYISAIKCILRDDDYQWNDNEILLDSLTKACRAVNDVVTTRLPIGKNLLELILFEVRRHFNRQPFLEILYQTIFTMGYYGLFRIGELVLASGLDMVNQHTVKAKDVHVAKNKEKIMVVLHSSKTHAKESRPQKVKITVKSQQQDQDSTTSKRFFCPFKLATAYMEKRGNYSKDNDLFFTFRNGCPVTDNNVRTILKLCISKLGLQPICYGFHSLRIGKATQMLKSGKSLEEIHRAGRWRSNTVYKYLRS